MPHVSRLGQPAGSPPPAPSPARAALQDLTNELELDGPPPAAAAKAVVELSPAISNAGAPGDAGLDVRGDAAGDLVDTLVPSIPRKLASTFAYRMRRAAQAQEAESAADDGDGGKALPSAKKKKKKSRVIFNERVMPLMQKLDKAVNKADASRGNRGKRAKESGASDSAESGTQAAASTAEAEKPAAVRGKKKSWQQRAKETDWSDNQSIREHFPANVGKRTLMPPKHMLAEYEDPLLKAHVLNQWNRLSHQEQVLLKQQFILLAEYDKAVAAAYAKERKKRAKEGERAGKKRQRQDRRNKTKRDNRTPKEPPANASLPPMSSKVFNNEEAAEKSASQKQLRATKKQRRVDSRPTRASQLNDKVARRATEQLCKQFAKTNRSFTPPPGTDTENWATNQSMLVFVNNMESPRRRSGTNKDRNLVPEPEEVHTNLTVCMGDGGREGNQQVVKHMINTGMYDDLIIQRAATLASQSWTPGSLQKLKSLTSGPPASKLNFSLVDNGDDLVARQKGLKEKRVAAEKERSPEEIANDPKVDAVQNHFSLEELEAEFS